jgi:hypothetical protein
MVLFVFVEQHLLQSCMLHAVVVCRVLHLSECDRTQSNHQPSGLLLIRCLCFLSWSNAFAADTATAAAAADHSSQG